MSEDVPEYLPRQPLPKGVLKVGLSLDERSVVVNHPDLQADQDGVGHIVFTPEEALIFAQLLATKAQQCKR